MKRDFLQSSTQGGGGISRYAIGEGKKRREMGKEGGEERRGEERRGEMDDNESNRGDGKRTVMRRKGSKKLDVN